MATTSAADMVLVDQVRVDGREWLVEVPCVYAMKLGNFSMVSCTGSTREKRGQMTPRKETGYV